MNAAATTRKLYIGDNLAVMRGIDSETADLIYLDPPFNSKSLYKGAMGSRAEKQQFSDTWKMSDINRDELRDIKINAPDAYDLIKLLGGINGESWLAYLTFMAVRLDEMHRVLKKTGSIYLHCDATMAAPLKLLMDIFFGRKNFRNEIIWNYEKFLSSRKKFFNRNNDVLLFYSKTDANIFNTQFRERATTHSKRGYVPQTFVREIVIYEETDDNRAKIQKYLDMGYKPKYFDFRGVPFSQVWDIPTVGRSSESTGWATQKPLALLRLVIKSSSNPGGLVLDPFCGCATACIAAEEEERQWIGIDIDPECENIMRERCEGESSQRGKKAVKDRSVLDWKNVEVINTVRAASKLPKRTDVVEIDKKDRREKARRYREQDGKCALCKEPTEIKFLEYDRVRPRKRGGRYTADNVKLLCANCNRIKGAGTWERAKKKIAYNKALKALEDEEDNNE